MTDRFELRLQRLADSPTGAAPSVAELHRRGRQRAIRRAQLTIAGVVVLLVVALLASLALATGQPSKVTTVTAVETTTTTTTTTTTAPSPPRGVPGGDQPIAGPDGSTVGTISAEDWAAAQLNGPPTLDIGTGAFTIRGFEVHDANGNLVGYFLPGDVGFLPLAEAGDAEHVDQIAKPDPPVTQEEARAIAAEIHARAEAQDRADAEARAQAERRREGK